MLYSECGNRQLCLIQATPLCEFSTVLDTWDSQHECQNSRAAVSIQGQADTRECTERKAAEKWKNCIEKSLYKLRQNQRNTKSIQTSICYCFPPFHFLAVYANINPPSTHAFSRCVFVSVSGITFVIVVGTANDLKLFLLFSSLTSFSPTTAGGWVA